MLGGVAYRALARRGDVAARGHDSRNADLALAADARTAIAKPQADRSARGSQRALANDGASVELHARAAVAAGRVDRAALGNKRRACRDSHRRSLANHESGLGIAARRDVATGDRVRALERDVPGYHDRRLGSVDLVVSIGEEVSVRDDRGVLERRPVVEHDLAHKRRGVLRGNRAAVHFDRSVRHGIVKSEFRALLNDDLHAGEHLHVVQRDIGAGRDGERFGAEVPVLALADGAVRAGLVRAVDVGQRGGDGRVACLGDGVGLHVPRCRALGKVGDALGERLVVVVDAHLDRVALLRAGAGGHRGNDLVGA